MAKFIKIKDNEMINIDRIVLMKESKRYSTDEPYTIIFLTNVPFPVEVNMTLEELYKLINLSSQN